MTYQYRSFRALGSFVPAILSRLVATKYGPGEPVLLGDLETVVCADNRNQVHIYFGRRAVHWLALPRDDAVRFAKTILHQAGAEQVIVRF